MKIIVMMKQVANKDAILRINKDATWIEEGDLSFEVSESDGYALEEAHGRPVDFFHAPE